MAACAKSGWTVPAGGPEGWWGCGSGTSEHLFLTAPAHSGGMSHRISEERMSSSFPSGGDLTLAVNLKRTHRKMSFVEEDF